MRRIPTACFSSVAAGLIAAAPASASDHDEQVWTSATATTALSPKVDTTLELHSRYTDDVSRTRFENTAANDEHRSWGRLREGAESYAKDLGQRYSPVRLMCSHPNGETWASRSGAIWVPLAARVLTTSPSFMVFQNMMMAASRFMPAMR
jgi:hypothetical protein